MNDQTPESSIKAKLVILSEIRDGKSSLGNFILNKKVPDSETKQIIGNSDFDEAEYIFLIDIPDLQDTRALDKLHIINMVSYINQHRDIQAIIVFFNINQDRIAPYLKTMIKIFNDILQSDDFWLHVGFVFTKYYYTILKKFESKKYRKLDKTNLGN